VPGNINIKIAQVVSPRALDSNDGLVACLHQRSVQCGMDERE